MSQDTGMPGGCPGIFTLKAEEIMKNFILFAVCAVVLTSCSGIFRCEVEAGAGFNVVSTES